MSHQRLLGALPSVAGLHLSGTQAGGWGPYHQRQKTETKNTRRRMRPFLTPATENENEKKNKKHYALRIELDQHYTRKIYHVYISYRVQVCIAEQQD